LVFVVFWTFTAAPATAQPTKVPEKESSQERIIRWLGGVLADVPIRLKTLKPEIRRLVFYDFRVDCHVVNPELKRVLQGMLEAELTKVPTLQIVNLPQVKPVRVIVTEDQFKLSRGLMSLEDMREVGERHRVDALVEADLYLGDNHLYLTISITELLTGSVIWKENFFTKPSEPLVKGFDAKSDMSAGLMIIPTSVVSLSSPTLTVGPTATYYVVELRFTEPAWPTRAVDFVLKGGALILASGTSFVGGGYAKTGLRLGVVAKNVTEAEALLGRDHWLSLEGNFGVLFPTGAPSVMSFGAQAEVDITRRFSFGLGVSYFAPFTATVDNSKISSGGVVWELMALKYYF